MTLTALIVLTVKVSILLNVIVIGLSATFEDATYLFRRPVALAKAFLSMNVAMPLFTVFLVQTFTLHRAVAFALIALSLSPIPPIFPVNAMKVGGRRGYTIGLLVTMAAIAIVFTPVALEALQRYSGVELGIPTRAIAVLIFQTVLGPLAVGMALRALAPAFVEKIISPLRKGALLLLAVAVAPILFAAFPAIRSLVGNGTVLALGAFVVVGHVAGHLLGGPNAGDRPVLAMATAARHPGVALALAAANIPEQKLSLAAVLLYVLVSAVVNVPYLQWVKRRHAAAPVGDSHVVGVT
jgi:bile acid:Na+ symporter, BASS family